MIWLIVGAVICVGLGMALMAALSIHRMRDTQAVADAAGAYLARGTDEYWRLLADAYDRLMAG